MIIIYKDKLDISRKELSTLLDSKYIAIDTETTGLDALKDRLCTIQITNGEIGLLIRYDSNNKYPNLSYLLFKSDVSKIFHNAVFDVNFLITTFNEDNIKNIICTKISSKLVNGLNSNNSLKGLVKKYLDKDISKVQQLSDWTVETLTKEQIEYAMKDIEYLYELWKCLEKELIKNNLVETAIQCFNFIVSYIKINKKGINNIFEY